MEGAAELRSRPLLVNLCQPQQLNNETTDAGEAELQPRTSDQNQRLCASDYFFLQHSDRSQAKHLQSNSSLAFKKKKKKNTPKLENCLGNQSLERAACRDASMHRSSGVAGAAEAGSPAAVRETKHSYANGISSSLGSVRVGESHAKNPHLNQSPTVRSGRGWMSRCGAAPLLRLSPPVLSLSV